MGGGYVPDPALVAAVTADQISRFRRMTDEPTDTIYSDYELSVYIACWPVLDIFGQTPYYDYPTYTAGVPGLTDNPNWMPTYDLWAAASDVWQEKASTWAAHYDVNADGADLSRSQGYEQAKKMARYCWARKVMGSVKLLPTPQPNPTDAGVPWYSGEGTEDHSGLVNAPEPVDGGDEVDW